jgi:eukaryotic-like serine/threonine-protein kinase
LLDDNALRAEDHFLLVRLVDSVIHAHRGDAAAALEAFGGDEAVQEAFAESIRHVEDAWVPDEERTILAKELPHGLPLEIAPESAGRYTGGSEYARGGIGRILLVHDEQIGRDVILKELLPHYDVSPTASTLSRPPVKGSPGTPMRQSASMMARFLQEAKITGQLEHPSIVPVYELGLRRDGQLYYAMRLVRGETLAAALSNCTGQSERLALLRSFLDVCQAMAYAHSKGVIHRDLKPSNIMVGEFGECVVLDWGLAKTQSETDAHKEAMEKTISQLRLKPEDLTGFKTRANEVLGTPLYMSPEQARGDVDDVGPRSDVFSMGVILYEILADRLPHKWTNSMDTVRRVGTEAPPSVLSAAPDTPPELAAICDKALQFAPEDRYASGHDLAEDVQQYLDGAVVGAYAYKFTDVVARLYRRHKTPILTSAVAAVAILLIGIFSYINIYQARNEAVIAQVDAEEQRDIAKVERDRAKVAEERTAQEKYVSDIRLAETYVRNFQNDAAERTLLATAPRFRHVEWDYLIMQYNQELATLQGHTNGAFAQVSHDGTRILTMSGDKTAKLWDAETEQVLYTWNLPGAFISDGAFSPIDTQIAIWTYDGHMHFYDMESGTKLNSWRAHEMSVRNAVFNNSGDRIVTAGDDRTIRVWDVETFEVSLEIVDLPEPMSSLGFSPDGRSVYAAPVGGVPVIFDALTGDAVARADDSIILRGYGGDALFVSQGQELRRLSTSDLAEEWRMPYTDEISRIEFFPEHDKLLVVKSYGVVELMDGASGQILRTFNFGGSVNSSLLSEAGDRVILLSYEGRIQIFDAEGGESLLALSQDQSGGLTTAVIAPDDAYLLTATRNGDVRKWPLAGIGQGELLAMAPVGFEPCAFSGDGRRVALAGPEGQLRVMDLEKGSLLYQATYPIFSGGNRASLNHDGTLLGVVLDEFLPVVISLPDGALISQFYGHRGIVKSIRFDDSSEEVVTASYDGTARIWNVASGELQRELGRHEGSVLDARFSPDGIHVATISIDETARVWNRATGETLFEVAHEAGLTSCAFSADGKKFASGSRDGAIHVWDVEAKHAQYVLAGQAGEVTRLAFSADAGRIVSNSGRGVQKVWDARQGVLLTSIENLGGGQAVWSAYQRGNDEFIYGDRNGNIARSAHLSEVRSTLDEQEELARSIESWRKEKRNRQGPTAEGTSSGPLHAMMPDAKCAAFLEHVRTLRQTPGSGALLWTAGADAPNIHPLRLVDGDIILGIGDISPALLISAEFAASFQTLLEGTQPVLLQVLRQETILRYVLHRLPTRQSERTITLQPVQAIALLRQALDTLKNDAKTLRQVSERSALERGEPFKSGPGTISGLAVPFPRDKILRKLYETAGLEPGGRIVAIGEVPLPSISDLVRLVEIGLDRLEEESNFEVQLELERGEFETRKLAVKTVSSD